MEHLKGIILKVRRHSPPLRREVGRSSLVPRGAAKRPVGIHRWAVSLEYTISGGAFLSI
jgi:hypothetical protein